MNYTLYMFQALQPWECVCKIQYVKKNLYRVHFICRQIQANYVTEKDTYCQQPAGCAGKEDAQRSHISFKGAQHQV